MSERIPERFRPILAAMCTGEMAPNIALMRLMIEAFSCAEIKAALAEARTAASDAVATQRLESVAALLSAHPDAFATVKAVMAEADHGGVAASCADAVRGWARVFDRLARLSPEGGVALYSLGSPSLLAEATSEVVARMREWDLLRPAYDMLELGCGAGRFVHALAPLVSSVTGLDVSAEMIARARSRCSHLANVTLRVSSGQNLTGTDDASVDVVLAADVFPYLVQSGGDLAGRHVAEAARVLRRGGSLLILNYSYRGDLDTDRHELARLLAADFRIERNGTRDFSLWDAAAFLGRKRENRLG